MNQNNLLLMGSIDNWRNAVRLCVMRNLARSYSITPLLFGGSLCLICILVLLQNKIVEKSLFLLTLFMGIASLGLGMWYRKTKGYSFLLVHGGLWSILGLMILLIGMARAISGEINSIVSLIGGILLISIGVRSIIEYLHFIHISQDMPSESLIDAAHLLLKDIESSHMERVRFTASLKQWAGVVSPGIGIFTVVSSRQQAIVVEPSEVSITKKQKDRRDSQWYNVRLKMAEQTIKAAMREDYLLALERWREGEDATTSLNI